MSQPADTAGGADTETGATQWLLEALCSRRSVSAKRLGEPGPSRAQLERLVGAALTAPDHCELKPWRFLHVTAAGRARLADAFAAARLELDPTADAASVERAREKAFRAPTLLAVILVPVLEHEKVPLSEQYVSLGAALQNVLLGAHALGFGAITLSGRAVTTTAMRTALGLHGDERLVAFVTIGTPRSAPPRRQPPVLSHHLADWPVAD